MRQSREITTKNMRHSNFDLLRILAMFMIVIYHIVCHCVTVQITNPASLGRETIDVFNHLIFLFICRVLLFLIIWRGLSGIILL